MGLSSRLPQTVRLEGLDISLEATTPKEWVPSNVSFREWDFKQDPPEDLVGQYDVVHLRLLILVLLDDEIPAVLQRFIKLLSMLPCIPSYHHCHLARKFQSTP